MLVSFFLLLTAIHTFTHSHKKVRFSRNFCIYLYIWDFFCNFATQNCCVNNRAKSSPFVCVGWIGKHNVPNRQTEFHDLERVNG